MCEYAIYDKNNPMLITCAPLNKLCTMCFVGNMNQYYECKQIEKIHTMCRAGGYL